MARSSATWTKDNHPKEMSKQSLTKILRELVDPRKIAMRLIELASDEDHGIRLSAIKYIYDRTDGTPIQSLRAAVAELPAITIGAMTQTLINEQGEAQENAKAVKYDTSPADAMAPILDATTTRPTLSPEHGGEGGRVIGNTPEAPQNTSYDISYIPTDGDDSLLIDGEKIEESESVVNEGVYEAKVPKRHNKTVRRQNRKKGTREYEPLIKHKKRK